MIGGLGRSPAQEYFGAVEEHFSRLRGRPLLLAPRDVALVKEWFEAGIPLRVVVRGLERFFAREARKQDPRRQPSSLTYCVADVYEGWDAWRAAHLGDDDGVDDSGSPEVPGTDRVPGARAAGDDVIRIHLGTMHARLTRSADTLQASGAPAVARTLRRTAEAVASWLAADELEIDEIEARLQAAEGKILRSLRRHLGAEGVTELRGQVRHQLEPALGGIDETAHRTLLRKAEERALLARIGLPRLALFVF